MTFTYDKPAEEIKQLLEEKIDIRMDKNRLQNDYNFPKGERLYGLIDGDSIRLVQSRLLVAGGQDPQRTFFGRITDGPDGAVITGRFRVPLLTYVIYFAFAALITLFLTIRGYGPGAVLLFGLFAAFWLVFYLSSRFLHRREERFVIELLRSLGDESEEV